MANTYRMRFGLVALAIAAGALVVGCGGGDDGGDGTGGGSANKSSGDTTGSGTGSGTTGSTTSTGSGSTSSGGAAACDNSQCDDFCLGAGSCLFPNDTLDHQQCKAKCAEYCGNGYFDDTDAHLIQCVNGLNALDCDGASNCCSTDFTSELCN